jgi:hypothetical protein
LTKQSKFAAFSTTPTCPIVTFDSPVVIFGKGLASTLYQATVAAFSQYTCLNLASGLCLINNCKCFAAEFDQQLQVCSLALNYSVTDLIENNHKEL